MDSSEEARDAWPGLFSFTTYSLLLLNVGTVLIFAYFLGIEAIGMLRTSYADMETLLRNRTRDNKQTHDGAALASSDSSNVRSALAQDESGEGIEMGAVDGLSTSNPLLAVEREGDSP